MFSKTNSLSFKWKPCCFHGQIYSCYQVIWKFQELVIFISGVLHDLDLFSYNIFTCDRVGRSLFENGLHVFEMFSETMSVLVENKHISIIGESLFWFPQCFGDRISFPFHIVLIASSLFLMINDRIHFVDFFFIVKFCWWFRKVRSIDIIFLVGSKESGMEDIMNLPRGMKLELIGHWSKDFCDNEWSFSFWSHFFIVLSLHVS